MYNFLLPQLIDDLKQCGSEKTLENKGFQLRLLPKKELRMNVSIPT